MNVPAIVFGGAAYVTAYALGNIVAEGAESPQAAFAYAFIAGTVGAWLADAVATALRVHPLARALHAVNDVTIRALRRVRDEPDPERRAELAKALVAELDAERLALAQRAPVASPVESRAIAMRARTMRRVLAALGHVDQAGPPTTGP